MKLNESVHNKFGFLYIHFANAMQNTCCLLAYLRLSKRLSYRENNFYSN
jgi:hypothetical protein